MKLVRMTMALLIHVSISLFFYFHFFVVSAISWTLTNNIVVLYMLIGVYHAEPDFSDYWVSYSLNCPIID